MDRNPNLALQERFVSAVFAGDAETVRALCTDDFALLEGSGLPFAGTFQGADGFLGFLELFGAAFEIERLEPVRSYTSDDPDRLAFEFDLAGIDRANGQRFESSLVELWTFADGRVQTIKPHYFNVPQRP
jgi:ketosteroid isomerase-like protein